MRVLDAAWMVDVAAGAAPRAVQVLAACHAELNAVARQELADAERTMGALLEAAEPVSLRAGAFEKLTAELDQYQNTARRPAIKDIDWEPPQTRSSIQIPKALRDVLGNEGLQWRKRIGGHQEIALEQISEPGVKARLICLEPGKGVASHTHDHEELTLVLTGGFNDGHSDYWAGEVCEADPELEHTPRALDGEPCVCLSVEFGRLSFTHPVLSLADRIMGWSRS